MPPAAQLTLKEEDVVRLTLEFLQNRSLHISQLSLERETGVINGLYSDDVLFLRQLILDGQWDDVLEFIQPLETLKTFETKRFRYIILQHKYVELLCIKSEATGMMGSMNVDSAVEEVVNVLNEIEQVAPSKEEYSNLCLMLTLPRLSDHLHYKDWNPSNARVRCFREVFPLVEKFLPCNKKNSIDGVNDNGVGLYHQSSKNDRLIQLIIKGILYESCVRYCQAKATGSKESGYHEVNFSRILDSSVGFEDTDLSLLSWLQSIPGETFGVPFEQRTLNIDIEQLDKPSLETSWTEHMLITPIKPKTFPHSAMPFTRPKSAADIMSRSLCPTLDGLSNGLQNSATIVNSYSPEISSRNKATLMALSTGDLNGISKSPAAGFHLTAADGGSIAKNRIMTTSVDRLFENENEVFLSGNYNDHHPPMPSISEVTMQQSPIIQNNNNGKIVSGAQSVIGGGCTNISLTPQQRPISRSPERRNIVFGSNVISATSTPSTSAERTHEHIPSNVINIRPPPVRRDSLSDRSVPSQPITPPGVSASNTVILSNVPIMTDSIQNYDQGDLMKEFQKQKQTLIIQEREKQELLRQLHNAEHFLTDECISRTNNAINNAVHNAGRGYNNVSAVSGHNFPNTVTSTGTVIVRTANGVAASIGGVSSSSGSSRISSCGGNVSSNSSNSIMTNGSVAAARSQHLPVQQHVTTAMTNGPRGVDDNIRYDMSKTTCRQDGDGQSNGGSSSATEANRPKFLPVTTLEDVQAVRCAEFHPRGTVYAIGSNSKILRICAYPNLTDLREDHTPCQPTVLFKRTRHHKGSIYCMSWTPDGDLLATGSNDKTVKLMRFNIDTANLEGQEIELAMHDGTVRDVCFIEDTSNKSSLLISGGAGDCKIYVTDCATGQAFQALSGHSGPILTLHNWGGAVFASGSQDRTVRFWDLRARGCTNIITPITSPANRQGSPVAAICVDPSGRLLVSGHEDSACVLYDIRGSRTLQSFRPHTSDVRSIRFSPSAYYLLTAGYDNKLVLTDLQGDLTASLPSVVVAQHQDKVISGRWHPAEFSFLSSSADKTATLWALPPA